MEIKDFDNIRVGSGFPACLDIAKIGTHENRGIYATFYDPRGSGSYILPRVEMRRKGNQYALFVFKWEDMDLPEWWEDSEIVWEL